MTRILIFGDSIAHGHCDPEGGWAIRLKNYCEKETLHSKTFNYSVYELGISAETTKTLLNRLEFEIHQRLKENNDVIFVFEIGLNDTFLVDKQEFENNLLKIIKIAEKYSSKIIFLGLTPVDESKTKPVYWNNKAFYFNKKIIQYNNIVKKLCKNKKIFFIEIYDIFNNKNYKSLLEDGLHPNTNGHELIFITVNNFLIKSKII